MGFALPDLVIESVIRDGLAAMKADLTQIDDIFSELLETYADRKYGAAEITRIKTFITDTDIAVVHSFHEGAAKSPAVSIQLGMDSDDKPKDAIDDFLEQEREPLTTAELVPFKRVDPFTPTDYDPLSGKVSVDNSDDISAVRSGNIYVDGSSAEHTILSGILNTTANKFFFIAKNATVDISSAGLIRSSITEKQFEIKVAVNDTQIMLGVHTKEALLTKYMYTIIKYILQSRKADLMKRCFDNPSIKGSDFTRDLEYQGDMVYTRFLTVSGRTEDTWKSGETPIIDEIEIDATAVDC